MTKFLSHQLLHILAGIVYGLVKKVQTFFLKNPGFRVPELDEEVNDGQEIEITKPKDNYIFAAL